MKMFLSALVLSLSVGAFAQETHCGKVSQVASVELENGSFTSISLVKDSGELVAVHVKGSGAASLAAMAKPFNQTICVNKMNFKDGVYSSAVLK